MPVCCHEDRKKKSMRHLRFTEKYFWARSSSSRYNTSITNLKKKIIKYPVLCWKFTLIHIETFGIKTVSLLSVVCYSGYITITTYHYLCTICTICDATPLYTYIRWIICTRILHFHLETEENWKSSTFSIVTQCYKLPTLCRTVRKDLPLRTFPSWCTKPV